MRRISTPILGCLISDCLSLISARWFSLSGAHQMTDLFFRLQVLSKPSRMIEAVLPLTLSYLLVLRTSFLCVILGGYVSLYTCI